MWEKNKKLIFFSESILFTCLKFDFFFQGKPVYSSLQIDVAPAGLPDRKNITFHFLKIKTERGISLTYSRAIAPPDGPSHS